MAGRTDGLIKSFRAAGAGIASYTIVKFDATDLTVSAAAAATDPIVGVTIEIPADANQRLDVAIGGIADVRFGGVVTRGDLLTTDPQGRAITAAPAAGAKARIIGMAMVSGVLGDIGPVQLAPGQISG